MYQKSLPYSVEADEVKKFEKMSENWWDVKGECKCLHTLNELRVPYVKDILYKKGILNDKNINSDQPLKGVKILDAGCGGGLFSEPLALLGAEVTGVDPTEELLNVAKHHASQNPNLTNLKYLLITVEEHADQFEDYYDCVVSSEVLEHITEVEMYLKACIKCLKPGGSLIAMTLSKTIIARVTAIWIAEYVLFMLPKGSHEYEKFICHQDVSKMLQRNGCKTLSVRGMIINPLTNRWWWFPSTCIHYALHAIKEEL